MYTVYIWFWPTLVICRKISKDVIMCYDALTFLAHPAHE